MRNALLKFPILDMLKGADATVDKPYPFKYEKLIELHEQFITHLKGMFNITKNVLF